MKKRLLLICGILILVAVIALEATNAMNKAMTWYGIQMKTMTDQSNEKISGRSRKVLVKRWDLW